MILAFSTMIFALNFGLFNEFDEHLMTPLKKGDV